MAAFAGNRPQDLRTLIFFIQNFWELFICVMEDKLFAELYHLIEVVVNLSLLFALLVIYILFYLDYWWLGQMKLENRLGYKQFRLFKSNFIYFNFWYIKYKLFCIHCRKEKFLLLHLVYWSKCESYIMEKRRFWHFFSLNTGCGGS